MNRTLIATLTTAALLAACQSKPTSNEAYESHKHARLSQYRNVLVMCFNEGPAREAWENAIVGGPSPPAGAPRRATTRSRTWPRPS